jgi:hypothetical protein
VPSETPVPVIKNPSTLSGVDLDKAVGQLEGLTLIEKTGEPYIEGGPLDDHDTFWCPSVSWEQGGPILEREGIALRRHNGSGKWHATLSRHLGDGQRASWDAGRPAERYGTHSYQVHRRRIRFEGETPLIAAMRCYVASKVGGEIIPDT